MKTMTAIATCAAGFGLFSADLYPESGMSQPAITSSAIGSVAGRPVTQYTLRNPGGMVASIMSYGATITSLEVPDRAGKSGDVVLGFDSLAGYLSKEPYLGPSSAASGTG